MTAAVPDSVTAYVDASVLLRVVFVEPNVLRTWAHIGRAVSSELVRIEALRTLDRKRLRDRLSDRAVAESRAAILEAIDAFELVPLEAAILERAAEPFPTSLGTLDALHLATALAVRDQVEDLVLVTHDERLGLAARSMGLPVEGIAVPG
jgi:predicted nucleic acid-binding protein